jgi:sporulation protein YlmC with PRC-barrel domain
MGLDLRTHHQYRQQESIMNTASLLCAGLACALCVASSAYGQASKPASASSGASAPSRPASASGATAPIAGRAVLGVTVAETQLIATGYRASKLLHQDVYNDKNEKIGKVDDLIVTPDGTLSIAVIDVGGFLGLAKHRVAIPVRQFAHVAPKAVLPGATKDQLKALPKFEYV